MIKADMRQIKTHQHNLYIIMHRYFILRMYRSSVIHYTVSLLLHHVADNSDLNFYTHKVYLI